MTNNSSADKLSRFEFFRNPASTHFIVRHQKVEMAHFARALVAPAVGGPLEFRDVLLDTVRPDEALIEIHAVGICHADISCLNGKLPVKFPIVFGHEGSYQ